MKTTELKNIHTNDKEDKVTLPYKGSEVEVVTLPWKNDDEVKIVSLQYEEVEDMTPEEKAEYFSKPYITKSGIIVESRYKEDGLTFNELMENYLRKKLEM